MQTAGTRAVIRSKVILLLALGVVIIPSACGKKTPSDSVQHSYLCLTKSNFKGFLEDISPNELKNLKISDSQAGKILALAWHDIGVTGTEKYVIEPNTATGSADLRLEITKQGGEKTSFLMTARLDPSGGIYLQDGIPNIVLSSMALQVDSNLPKKLRLHQAVLTRYKKFEELGLNGILLDGKYISWQEYLSNLETKSKT